MTEDFDPMAEPDISVTVLTGFLGAGKTTLLNRILKENHGLKIAVIENELGEQTIDNDLLVQDGAEQIVTMNNGCICCTIRGDLSRVLTNLRIQRDKGEIDFDHVVIETTGVANPGPVCQTFFMDDAVAAFFRLDGVVTLRNNEVGDLFSAAGGTGIYQVMQMNPLKAYVYVSEQYFPHVYMGMPVEVRLDIYPDETFAGKVSRIAPALDASSRTFEVEVTIPNGEMRLRPGMYARTIFNMGVERNVTVLDVAVQRMSGTNERYVYVVDNGRVERRFVTVGRQVGDRMEILDGVKAGEQVVIAGSARLLGGMEVSVMEGE